MAHADLSGGVVCLQGVLDDIDRFVRETPDAPCIGEGTWHVNYAEMAAITDTLAREILARVGRIGGRVVWIGGAGAARLLTYIAIQKAAQVLVAPALSMTDDQVRAILNVSGQDLVVIEQGFEGVAARLAPGPSIVANFSAGPGAAFERPTVGPQVGSHIGASSGSTGMPKAMIRSRGDMEYFIRLACRLQGLGPGDRTALLGNLWNPTQFTGLSVGAYTLCFDVPRRGASDLAQWMQDEAVTTVMIYPAIFREIMATGRHLPDLRCIILIGEPLTRSDAEAHARICAPEAELVNIYGSMEFAYLTAWRRRGKDPVSFEVMPMGGDIVPGEMRLIDESGCEVPDGATGEIQITSHHVADGYLGNPELNKERFGRLPDGRRTLLMGDLAYRDFAGIYHSVGRRDQQTKIRGYNVRPLDVELVVQRQVGVEQAVVVARDSARGIRRLVCYYTGVAEPGFLKPALAGVLPAYMTPAIWHRMDAFPKTHSGKVIRGDLPDPFAVAASPEPTLFRSRSERVLARLVSEILEISAFGPDEDFFDLGGDSLQAMRLVIEAETELGRRLPFEQMILNGATVSTLARFFDDAAPSAPSVLRPGRGGHTLVLSHGKGGHLSDYLEVLHALDPALRVVGANGVRMSGDRDQANMIAMADTALGVLSGELEPGAFTLMGYSFGVPIAVEIARRLAERDGEAPPLVLLDPLAPWRDPRRWLRPIRDDARAGDLGAAFHGVRRGLSAAFDSAPKDVNEAHSVAWLRYQPRPLSAKRVLVIQATERGPRTETDAWLEAFDPAPEVVQASGDHLSMMRGDNAGMLAQMIQKWVAETA